MRHDPLTDRSVLVTGGTGSFGTAFARYALGVGARRVVVFSRDELKQSEMRAQFPDPRLRFVVGDVRDRERVRLAARGVEYLVHAAAMKQIPTCETDPIECKRTNVDGTEAVALASIEAGVGQAVFLSTDKAAYPNTHYGACKLVAERLWTQANVYAAGTPTRLVATRYGNVMGSRGSVLPLWSKQAKAGKPLTVTDRAMTRFFMSIHDAVDLVVMALKYGCGGEVFVPRIGAVDLTSLAEAFFPGHPVTEIGVRPGEKMHETLISEDESRNAFDHGDHYRIEPNRTWGPTEPTRGTPVPVGWSYRSDTNPWRLSGDELRAMAYGE